MAANQSQRRPFFCGNWKLNGNINDSVELASQVRNGVATWRDVDVAVAPSFLAIPAVVRRLEGGPVAVAGQNCFWEDKGAYTGEVSATQLVDAGCKYVIVGHSERRQLMGELDAAVNLKARGRDAGADPGAGRRRHPGHLGRRSSALPHRLRAGVGDRDRPQRHPRAGAGGASLHSRSRRCPLRGCRGGDSNPLRW
jgi:hypothetical protein